MKGTPSLRGRSGLFAKYFLSLVGIVTLVLLINGVLDMWFAYGSAREALGHLQQEKANGAADKVSQFINDIDRQIAWTTQPQWATGPVDQRRIDFIRLQRQVPAITDLTQIDGEGREQLKVSSHSMDVIGSNTDLSTDPRFTEVQNKRVWYSPVYLRKESEPYMSISLARTGRRTGATVAEVNLKLIRDVVSAIKVGEKGYAYVVDRDGRLIAHPDISLVLRNTDMSGIAQVHNALTTLRDNTPARADSATFGRSLDGAAVLSSVAAIPKLGWLVFVEQPTSEALQPLYTSLWQTLALLGLGLTVAAVGAWFMSRRMAAPIRALSAGVERVGSGDLAHRIDVKTGDEVETLASNFNRMAGQLQESYADLEQKVETRTHELARSVDELTASGEVLRLIASSPDDLQPMFATLLDHATRLCGAHFGILWLREDGDDPDILSAVALRNVPEPFAGYLAQGPHRLSADTAVGRAVRTLKPQQIDDIRLHAGSDPMRRATADLGSVRTLVAVPMVGKGEAIGVLAIFRQEVLPFNDAQLGLVSTFADQAVIAIENSRLLRELRARTSELSESLENRTAMGEVLRVISQSPTDVQPVLEAIVAAARRFCGAGDALIILRDGDHAVIAAHEGSLTASVGRRRAIDRTSLTGRAILEGRTMHTPDSALLDPTEFADAVAFSRQHKWRAAAAVPMLRDGVAGGAIMLRKSEAGAFTTRQIELLEAFAAQAVIAIENVRLFTELRESLEQQTAMAEILRVTSQSPTDVRPVLVAVAKAAVRFCGAEDAVIVLSDGPEVAIEAHEGPISADRKRWPLDRSTAMGRAIIDGRTVHLSDVTTLDPVEFAGTRTLGRELGFKAAVAAPMMREDHAIGAVLLRKIESGAFMARQVELLETFAAQAVIAIENVRLFTEIQEKSRQLELASQHKSQFLANMSHELRTPLNAIIGYTEMMADGLYGDVGTKAQGVLERVQANGRHLLGLINDVLDLSKIEAGQLTLAYEPYIVTDMVATVVSATESLARTKGLVLSSSVAPDLTPGLGDARRLSQVLLNLVGNAIKFTDQGSVEIRAAQTGDQFELSVVDSGLGIKPEDQARIFDEFQQVDDTSTRKKGGTGLGLSISRRIVELHGGRIEVKSTVGHGSTFTVTIPVTAAPLKDAA